MSSNFEDRHRYTTYHAAAAAARKTQNAITHVLLKPINFWFLPGSKPAVKCGDPFAQYNGYISMPIPLPPAGVDCWVPAKIERDGKLHVLVKDDNYREVYEEEIRSLVESSTETEDFIDGLIELLNPGKLPDGSVFWFNRHGYHRDNGLPAVVRPEEIYCYVNGRLHHDKDTPAVIISRDNGYVRNEWYKNGELHREGDKPAFMEIIPIEDDLFGSEVEALKERMSSILRLRWYKNGLLHRDGGKPAVIEPDIILKYRKNGLEGRDRSYVEYFLGVGGIYKPTLVKKK